MSLAEQARKIKGFLGLSEERIILLCHILIVLLVGFGGYLLGVLSGGETQTFSYVTGGAMRPMSEKLTAALPEGERGSLGTAPEEQRMVSQGNIVASRQGTKYHRTDCSGAKTIKPENKVYFSSEEEARGAGYLPAGNCPGLK